MRTSELRRITAKWQARLGLTGWDITVEFVHPDEMGGRKRVLAYGEIHYHSEEKYARILVADPCHGHLFAVPPNPEETVVHELLHLVTDPIVRRRGGSGHEDFLDLMASLLTKPPRKKAKLRAGVARG